MMTPYRQTPDDSTSLTLAEVARWFGLVVPTCRGRGPLQVVASYAAAGWFRVSGGRVALEDLDAWQRWWGSIGPERIDYAGRVHRYNPVPPFAGEAAA